jgi:hypothetical protein
MAFVLNDRVKETTTTTGSSDITFAGAVTNFETFAAGIGNNNLTYYAIVHSSLDQWEVGVGTLSADSSTMERTTVISSTNSDSAVVFSAGTKEVFCTYPGSRAPSAGMTATTYVTTHNATISDTQTMDSGVLAGPVSITGSLSVTGNLYIL